MAPQFIPGVGIDFRAEGCCVTYNATTDLLVSAHIGQMSIYDPSITFDGTWFLETQINEQFQVTNPGSVSLFGDVGNGYELLLSGHVTGIGFLENITEFDSPAAFYGVFFMQLVFEIDAATDLMTSIFGSSGSFLTGHRIGDPGFFLPGERTDSPFAQDFRCGASSFRCTLNEGSYGLNALTQVPEPGTLALLGIGLFGMGLSRRKRA